MRKIILAAAMTCVVILGGCAQLQNDWNIVTGATISPTSIYVAANAFDALEQTATNYLKLPACGTNAPTLCRNQAAVSAIVPLIRSGRIARNQLEAAVSNGGSTPIPATAYSVLQNAISSLKQIFAEYGLS
jgi:hypothetical protein